MNKYQKYMNYIKKLKRKNTKFVIGKKGIKFDYLSPGLRNHISAFFKWNKIWYWASVVESWDRMYGDTECMIFKAPGDDIHPRHFNELYLKPNAPVTKESLIACIREFCS